MPDHVDPQTHGDHSGDASSKRVRAIAAMEGFLGIDTLRERESTGSKTSQNDSATIAGGCDSPVQFRTCPPGYEILEELGRGGMGVVYKARHVMLNRIVALKMILAGEHSSPTVRVRFLAEAEAVARLQHQNIISLLEFGEVEGLPYFTLEFAPNGSLASQFKGVPQSPREAAHIIQQLALGVDHAHSQGIVHRDLKPANVLLAQDGTPKITDFGLARRGDFNSGLTATGDILGTPSYMAPEQAGGGTKQAGPTADIYALGAILYEFLTGRPPFRAATIMETLWQVLNQEPVSVQQLHAQTPMDLATICHKCLQKDPRKRYASAKELAEDCAAFLGGKPIKARPVSALERAGRWCRHHPAIAGVSAAALLFLVTGLIGMTVLYFRAEAQRQFAESETLRANGERDKANEYAAEVVRQKEQADQQRNLARDQAERARQVTRILTGMFSSLDPLGLNGLTFGLNNHAGQTLNARDLLDRGLKITEQDSTLSPVVKAEVFLAIGNVYRSIGLHDLAEPLLTRAYKTRKASQASPAEMAVSIHALGWYHHERGNYPLAEAYYREALQSYEQSPTRDERTILNTQFNLAWLLAEMNEGERAEELGNVVLQKRIELFGEDHRETALTRIGLASIYLNDGKPDRALPLVAKSLLTLQTQGIDKNILNAAALFQQAVIQAQLMNNLKKATELMHQCLQMTRDALPPRHLYIALPLTQLGIFLSQQNLDAEALKAFTEAFEVARVNVGLTHPKLLIIVQGIARIQRRNKQGHLATPLFEEVLAAQRKSFGEDHVFVADTLLEQANHELQLKKDDNERQLLQSAEKIYRASTNRRPPRLLGQCLKSLGDNCSRRKSYADSERYYRDALAIERQLHLKAHHDFCESILNVAYSMIQQGKFTPECETLLAEAELQLPELPAPFQTRYRQDWLRLSCELRLGRDADHMNTMVLVNRYPPSTKDSKANKDLARICIQCLDKLAGDQHITQPDRERFKEKYSAVAVDLLRQAWKAQPELRSTWIKAREFEPLHHRPDFQKLVVDMENQTSKPVNK